MSMHTRADNTPANVLPTPMAVGVTFCAATLPWLVFAAFLAEHRLVALVAFVIAVPGLSVYGFLGSCWARSLAQCDTGRPRALAWASLAGLWGTVAVLASWPCWILWWVL